MTTLIRAKQHICRPGAYFRSCHASTLTRLQDGTIAAAWFAGSHENHVDVGIWLSTCEGGVFTAPRLVASDPEWPCWNPVLHLGRNGLLYLFYKVGETPDVWHTMLMVSRDNAHTWSQPRILVPGDDCGRGPAKNKLLVRADGAWLAPGSRETKGLWESFVDISADKGATWRQTPNVPTDRTQMKGAGIIQPTLWASSPGDVHMLLRSSEGCIYRSDSTDGGETFCAAYRTNLPNNNSGLDAVRMQNGALALVYNPVDVNWGARTPLSLAISADNGVTWPVQQVLEENLAPLHREDGEFSYPAVIAHADRLHITYTWRRKTVEYMEIEVKA